MRLRNWEKNGTRLPQYGLPLGTINLEVLPFLLNFL